MNLKDKYVFITALNISLKTKAGKLAFNYSKFSFITENDVLPFIIISLFFWNSLFPRAVCIAL